MIDHRPRSSYESHWLPYTKVTARSAVRTAIGQALSSRYEVPRDLLVCTPFDGTGSWLR